MNTKHTPGQWSINGNKIDGNGYHLASINSHSTIEGQANSRLIAAAPEILEALEDCERNMIISTQADMARLDRIRAAIAKAKGGAA